MIYIIAITDIADVPSNNRTEWTVSINGGPEQKIVTETSIYGDAARAALALCKYDKRPDYNVVKIHVELLTPDYGPYFYGFTDSSEVMVAEERKW